MNVSEKLISKLQEFAADNPRFSDDVETILTLFNDGNPNFKGDFIAIRSHDVISYMPSNKVQEMTENGLWMKKGRQEITIGRFFTKFLPDKKSHEVKDFTESYINFVEGFLIEILDNDKIQNVYDNGPSSCMQGKPVGKFHSHLNTKIAVIRKNSNIVARCILWEEVFTHPGKPSCKAYDSIYALNDSYDLICKLEEFVKDHGYKNSDCLPVSIVKVYGELEKSDFYPYMDTFCHISSNLKYLSNNSDIFPNYELSSTYGHLHDTDDDDYDDDYDDHDRSSTYYNPISRQYITENDAVFIDGFPFSRHDPKVCYTDGEYVLTKA